MRLFILCLCILPAVCFGKQECLKPEGCRLTIEGKCIGCVHVSSKEEPENLPAIRYDGRSDKNFITTKPKRTQDGIIKPGKYIIEKIVNEEGYTLVWEKPLVIDFMKLGEGEYILMISGNGLVNGKKVDCTIPQKHYFSIDEKTGAELSFTSLSLGSCPNSKPVFIKNTFWKRTPDGMTKKKEWGEDNNGTHYTCVIQPCDWIQPKSRTYFYKKI